VNISSAGTYTVNFRVASMFTGAQFQVRNTAGSVLTTVTVPNTGSFQSWQTVSASLSLPAGQQTLRLYTSNAAGGWNINWWEILASGSAGVTVKTASTEEVLLSSEDAPAMEVFPNPVQERFCLKVDNKLKGKVKVSLISLSGQLIKEFTLSKASEAATQWYLSLNNIPAGSYLIKASINQWSQSIKIVKE